MLELCTLASGSGGNCMLLTDGTTHILLDAGLSARRTVNGLRELGLQASDLAGVLITHEHSDHISGLAVLTKQFSFPIYATQGTARQLNYRIAFLEDRLHTFQPGDSFAIGSLELETFPTPHDAAQSVGYAVSSGGRKAAVVTDLGYVTQEVYAGVRGAHLAVVETNHDVDLLRDGPYPYHLKQRILGERGHLSNEAGAALAAACAEGGASVVVLAHLSAQNNTPQRAYTAVRAALERVGAEDVAVDVAPRSGLGRRYRV